MNYIYENLESVVITLAAVAFVGWPVFQSAYQKASALFQGPGGSGTKVSVSYQAAIAHLASVRSRLAETGGLSDEQKGAIDVLTLALVAGSDVQTLPTIKRGDK